MDEWPAVTNKSWEFNLDANEKSTRNKLNPLFRPQTRFEFPDLPKDLINICKTYVGFWCGTISEITNEIANIKTEALQNDDPLVIPDIMLYLVSIFNKQSILTPDKLILYDYLDKNLPLVTKGCLWSTYDARNKHDYFGGGLDMQTYARVYSYIKHVKGVVLLSELALKVVSDIIVFDDLNGIAITGEDISRQWSNMEEQEYVKINLRDQTIEIMN